MIRIIDLRSLGLLAALTAFCALNGVACTQNVTDDTNTQDDEIRRTVMVDVSGSTNGGATTGIGDVPATAAHPTTRLGPHPDPWTDDPNGPHPDPWSGRSGDGSGSGNGTSGNPGPSDPSNPNQ